MIDPFQKKLLEEPLNYQERIAKIIYGVLRSQTTVLQNYEHVFYGAGPKGVENKFIGSVVHSISKVRLSKVLYPKMEEGAKCLRIDFQDGYISLPIGRITDLSMYLYLDSREVSTIPLPIDLIITYGEFRRIATAVTLRDKLAQIDLKIGNAESFIPKLVEIAKEYKEIKIIE